MRDRLVALKSIFAGLALGERERETERENFIRNCTTGIPEGL